MLIAENVSKSYSTAAGPLPVLENVSLTLAPGDSLSIMGPSGSGKSTLLHILGALDPPTSGTVTLDGANPYTLDEPAQARFRNRHIGFVFQDHALLPQLTLLENVLVPVLVGEPAPDAETRARALLDRVGLAARLAHKPAELSGGEKQRTAIARALIRRPALLLCDEPTGNLDRRSAESIAQLLTEIAAEGQTAVVVVTHSPELARRFASPMQILDGRLCALTA